MVFFNWATMQMAAKIVYYGPGLCGKTTNLSYIYAKTAPGSRGEMVSLETETDRTLFFDLLPLEVGKVGGFRTRLQLYTVPGQVFYNTTRKLVLKGVDGVVFVADSQKPMAEANVESFRNLEENLAELGLEIAAIPLVIQYNKRDLKNILTVDELTAALNRDGRWEGYEAVAVQGLGVFETLKAITKNTLKTLRRRMVQQEGAPAGVPAPRSPRTSVTFNPAALSAAAAEGLSAAATALATAARASAEPRPAAVVRDDVVPAPPQLEAVPTDGPQRLVQLAHEEAEVFPLGDEAPLPPEAAEITQEAVEVVTEEVEEPSPLEIARPLDAGREPKELEVAGAEEGEETPVEFATTPEPEPVRMEAEVRHVKVSSSLDILAELETLRKAAMARPTPQAKVRSKPGLDLDALLQTSLNSRQEVRRRVEQQVGEALKLARQCLVRIELVDGKGNPVSTVAPIEVDIKRGERLKQLALTLTVHLHGE
jgi:signal recognition particle receptor subunit beta